MIKISDIFYTFPKVCPDLVLIACHSSWCRPYWNFSIHKAKYTIQCMPSIEMHACVSNFKQLPLDTLILCCLFADCLGSTVFAPIKADIAGNITVSAFYPLAT